LRIAVVARGAVPGRKRSGGPALLGRTPILFAPHLGRTAPGSTIQKLSGGASSGLTMEEVFVRVARGKFNQPVAKAFPDDVRLHG
jgi:hypothetical protein